MVSADEIQGRQLFYDNYKQAVDCQNKLKENKLFDKMIKSFETFNSDFVSDFPSKLEKLAKENLTVFKREKYKEQKLANVKKYFQDKFEKMEKEKSEGLVPKERFLLLTEKISQKGYLSLEEKNLKKEQKKAALKTKEENLKKQLLSLVNKQKENVEKQTEDRKESDVPNAAVTESISNSEEKQQVQEATTVEEVVENQPSTEAEKVQVKEEKITSQENSTVTIAPSDASILPLKEVPQNPTSNIDIKIEGSQKEKVNEKAEVKQPIENVIVPKETPHSNSPVLKVDASKESVNLKVDPKQPIVSTETLEVDDSKEKLSKDSKKSSSEKEKESNCFMRILNAIMNKFADFGKWLKKLFRRSN